MHIVSKKVYRVFNIINFFFLLILYEIDRHDVQENQISAKKKKRKKKISNRWNLRVTASVTISWNRFVSAGTGLTDLLNSPWELSPNGDQIYSEPDRRNLRSVCAKYTEVSLCFLHGVFTFNAIWISRIDGVGTISGRSARD